MLALAGSGCGGRTAAPPPAPPPPPVTVSTVLQADVPAILEMVGRTEASSEVEIRTRVEGFVKEAPFREGSIVKAGDTLFVLDDEPIRQKLMRTKAQLSQQEASLAKARQDVARLKPLAEQRAIPRQDYENAQAAEMGAQAGVAAAQAEVRGAEIDLGYAVIKAPMGGLIGAGEVGTGDLVGRGSPTLMTIISCLDPVRVVCSLSEVEYLKGRKAAALGPDTTPPPATLVTSDGAIYPHAGRFIFADRTVDPATGTLKLKAEFPNPDALFRPGQFVRLRVPLADRAGAILVPQRAVQEVQGEFNVWVLGDGGTVSFRRVRAGQRVTPLWVIDDGLKPGEKVVVEGLTGLRDGAKVTPSEAPVDDAPVKTLRKQFVQP